MSNISDLREKIEKYAAYRDISVEVKEESKLMKIIAKILFFNPKFMTDYITTIGSTVYFPREDISNDVTVWEVLPHEMIHADDSRRLGPLFGFLYLFPQILAILSLLAFGALGGNLNWLYWLLFLHCICRFSRWVNTKIMHIAKKMKKLTQPLINLVDCDCDCYKRNLTGVERKKNNFFRRS